jgi:hypothetical protein
MQSERNQRFCPNLNRLRPVHPTRSEAPFLYCLNRSGHKHGSPDKRIPANTRIGIIAAIAVTNPPIQGKPPGKLFSAFTPPQHFHLKGSYLYNKKEITVDEQLFDLRLVILSGSIF